MKCGFRQICKLFEQDNSISTSALGGFSNESLPWILPHMVLKIPDLIRQQETVRHKFVI